MAGTKFKTCLECYEKSRVRKGWWCPHCGHMKPSEELRISSLGPDHTKAIAEWGKVKDMGYKEWLSYKQLEASPKTWDSYIKRQFSLLPLLPK